MPEAIAFKAHARLLTMLGEQLIKNERIALVELVKNSYDADATWVAVDFRNFGDDYRRHPGFSHSHHRQRLRYEFGDRADCLDESRYA